MRKLVFCFAVILCLVLIVPVAWGCSETEEENTFVKLLSLLPDTAREGRVITLIDYEKVWEVNGISVYDEDGNRLNREDYFDKIFELYYDGSFFGVEIMLLSTYWTGGWQDGEYSPINDTNTGYEYPDIDAEISTKIFELYYTGSFFGVEIEPNPIMMIAAIGDYNQQATDIAMTNRSGWPSRLIDNYVAEDYKDITINSWGDSQETHLLERFKPPHLDKIGRAMSLAVSDGLLFVGNDVDYIKSMIDANLNETDSLADIPEYALAAQGMYDLGVIGALFVDEAHTKDFVIAFEPATGLGINDFLTVAMGPGRDEAGEYFALAIVYDSKTMAEEGVLLLKEKIYAFNTYCDNSDYREDDYIYETEIYTDDRVLLAKMYTENQMLWKYWFFNQW